MSLTIVEEKLSSEKVNEYSALLDKTVKGGYKEKDIL